MTIELQTPAILSADRAVGGDYPAERAASGPPRGGWSELPQLPLDTRRLERNRIVVDPRGDSSHVPLDMLRTKLMKSTRENGWSTIAITSPTPSCGKTTIALNLAFSLARQSNFRVGLLDLDLRRPSVARLLGCERRYAIDRFLVRQRSLSESLLRHGRSLVIAPNSAPVPDAAEVLQAHVPGEVIPSLQRMLRLDLLIFDLPPMLAADDVLAVLPAVDAVLLVAAADQSTISEVDSCERELTEQGKFLGLVLNKCRFVPQKYGY